MTGVGDAFSFLIAVRLGEGSMRGVDGALGAAVLATLADVAADAFPDISLAARFASTSASPGAMIGQLSREAILYGRCKMYVACL